MEFISLYWQALGVSWLDLVAAPMLGAVFLLLLWLQWQYPLRCQHFTMLGRMVRNLIFASPSFITLRLALVPIPLAVALWAEQHQFGLLHWLPLPAIIVGGLGIILFDYAYYAWHIATHR